LGRTIGNVGGIEMNLMTNNTPDEIKAYVGALLPETTNRTGQSYRPHKTTR